MNGEVEISIVLPCLNEEEALKSCIQEAQETLDRVGRRGEIIIVDNGSTDRSREIAEENSAIVINESREGYGYALRKGITSARGKYIIIADADGSYDLTQIPEFLECLENGSDLVIGNRFNGRMERGAMRLLNRFGNIVLTRIMKVLFRTGIHDTHCGMRGFTKTAYERMHLVTGGMDFASEMIINSSLAGLSIKEIPAHYRRRRGNSKLSVFRDGWRHLEFMILYSPTKLFLIPGISLFILGIIPLLALVRGQIIINGRAYDVHLMVMGSLFSLLGFQIANLGLIVKAYSLSQRFVVRDRVIEFFYHKFTLGKGLLVGIVLFLLGFIPALAVVIDWARSNFGPLNEIRRLLVASYFMIVGVQVVFSSFIASIMVIKHSEK